MPQMMPMNWMLLMIMFLMCLYLTMVKIYFLFLYNPKNNNIIKKTLMYKIMW